MKFINDHDGLLSIAVPLFMMLFLLTCCISIADVAKEAQAAADYYLQEWQETVNRENHLRAELADLSKEYHILYEEYEGFDNIAWQDIGKCTITHYCGCVECCGKSDCITATGTRAVMGHTVAVDPDIIPLGSEVLINGVIYRAEDTGVVGQQIDIYIESHTQAVQMGTYQTNVCFR